MTFMMWIAQTLSRQLPIHKTFGGCFLNHSVMGLIILSLTTLYIAANPFSCHGVSWLTEWLTTSIFACFHLGRPDSGDTGFYFPHKSYELAIYVQFAWRCSKNGIVAHDE